MNFQLCIDPQAAETFNNVDVVATAGQLAINYHLNPDEALRFTRLSLGLAATMRRKKEREYLFVLARHLMSACPIGHSSVSAGSALAPYALVFGRAIFLFGTAPKKQRFEIDWNEDDLLMMSFRTTWMHTKYGADENPLIRAIREARDEPLAEYTGDVANPYIRNVLNIALCLQVSNGAEPIQLPIYQLGEALGLQPQRVSEIIQLASLVEIKGVPVLTCIDASYSHARKKAKDYKFNIAVLRDDYVRIAA
jgi:hypothetical protein